MVSFNFLLTKKCIYFLGNHLKNAIILGEVTPLNSICEYPGYFLIPLQRSIDSHLIVNLGGLVGWKKENLKKALCHILIEVVIKSKQVSAKPSVSKSSSVHM